MAYADVNGQRIFYEDSGTDGPPIVFSHGFLMDHEMWRPQVEALGGEHRCIAYDERGWGQTEASPDPFDYWDLADDCLALVDALALDGAVLVGMSQGGFLTLRAAIRAPERVRGIVLIDTDPFAESPETAALYRDIIEGAYANGVTDDMVATFASFLFGAGFDYSVWAAKWKARPARAVEPAVECLVGRDDVSARLGEIRCPALVVHGEHDVPFAVDSVEGWASRLGDLRGVVRVAGAGHTSCLECPDGVTPALTQFLATLS